MQFSWLYNKLSVFKDLILNILCEIIVMAALQLFILPQLSKAYNSNLFGSIISLYGINTIIITLTGDPVANVRLISNSKNGINFSIISIFDSLLLSFILSLGLFVVYGHDLSYFDIILFSITTSLMSFIEYGISLYRINLKYNRFLVQNLFVVIGYIVGFMLFKIFHHWSLIFFVGNLFGMIFLLTFSGIVNDYFYINYKIKTVLKSLMNISIGHVASSITSNLDRLLIPIILGMSSLTPFFAANTVAKIFTLIISPLSDVLLSYLSKLKLKWNRKKLNILIIYISILGVIISIPTYYISIICLKILYSNIFETFNGIRIITFLSSISVSLYSMWNVINVFWLMYLKSSFQIYVNLLFVLFYALFSLTFSLRYGLLGFSSGYTLSIILVYIITIILSNIKYFWKISY